MFVCGVAARFSHLRITETKPTARQHSRKFTWALYCFTASLTA